MSAPIPAKVLRKRPKKAPKPHGRPWLKGG